MSKRDYLHILGLYLLLSCSLFSSCKERVSVNKSELIHERSKGIALHKGKPFTGYSVTYYNDSIKAEIVEYKTGLKDGEFKKVIKKLLSEVAMGIEGVCVGVKDSSAPFLKFLDRNNIAIRDTIKVVEKEEFDGSLYIEVNGKTVHISNQIATNLYLELKEEEHQAVKETEVPSYGDEILKEIDLVKNEASSIASAMEKLILGNTTSKKVLESRKQVILEHYRFQENMPKILDFFEGLKSH